MMGLAHFLSLKKIYSPEDIEEAIKHVRHFFRFTPPKNKVKYFNIPCAFDIETTSFFRQSEKVASMYVWMFSIYGVIIVGRTWEQFINTMKRIVEILDLNEYKRIIVYVHNLSFDFSFFRKWFEWKNVFSIKSRTPIYALTVDGIEFRCSYLLSGYNLDTLAKNLTTYNIKKLVGDLDYRLVRHSDTPLTEKELSYCVNDVKILIAYIGEQIDRETYINNIPLTKTGYVRNYCRMHCFYENGVYSRKSNQHNKYMNLIKSLRLIPEEYMQMKRAFQGGFTHANPFFVNKIIEDVTSFDFTSSYPAVMVSEQFPMSSGEYIEKMSKKDFNRNLKNYCCIFDIELFDVEPKLFFDNYLSSSRCRELKDYQTSNGRIVKASHLKTTITEQDYFIIKKFYKWDESKTKIAGFRRYKKDYLPTEFIKSILDLYAQKTELKGVKGKENEYAKAKELLNSCYGMTVTDIVRDEITYIDNMWPGEGIRKDEEKPLPDYEKEIIKYNNNNGRFLFYAWGLYVTAYARRNLFTGILEFGEDYIYSDTDSIKVRNVEKHIKYIDKYNDLIVAQLYKAMMHHKLPLELIEPVTIDGVKKPLGVWDFDGHYKRFKTLGAKRYLVEYSADKRNKQKNQYLLTVAGLNKNSALPYMIEQSKGDVFNFFKHGMYIPPQYTGKMTHTYLDEDKQGYITDYMGVTHPFHELSGVHLSPAEYSLSLSSEFMTYLKDIQPE